MESEYAFKIEEPVIAYYRTRSRRSRFGNLRAARYYEYKARVKGYAEAAGVPQLGMDDEATVSVFAFWKKRARADADSIIKSTLDSIWERDRRVLRPRAWSLEQRGKECAWVVISIRRKGEQSPAPARALTPGKSRTRPLSEKSRE